MYRKKYKVVWRSTEFLGISGIGSVNFELVALKKKCSIIYPATCIYISSSVNAVMHEGYEPEI